MPISTFSASPVGGLFITLGPASDKENAPCLKRTCEAELDDGQEGSRKSRRQTRHTQLAAAAHEAKPSSGPIMLRLRTPAAADKSSTAEVIVPTPTTTSAPTLRSQAELEHHENYAIWLLATRFMHPSLAPQDLTAWRREQEQMANEAAKGEDSQAQQFVGQIAPATSTHTVDRPAVIVERSAGAETQTVITCPVQ